MNLYPHQQKEVDDYGLHPYRGLLWCPRAGKSRAVVATAKRMHREGMIAGMLITSPNGVHLNWARQELHPFLGEGYTWVWDTKTTDVEMLVQLESLRMDRLFALSVPGHLWTLPRVNWFLRFLRPLLPHLLFVVDESHEYASPSSKRSWRVRSISPKTAARRILTGTPWHDSVLNVWSQLEILEKGLSGQSTYTDFSRRYGEWKTRFGPHGSYPGLIGYRNVDEIMTIARENCSIIRPSDIPDMPRTVNKLLNFDLSPETEGRMTEILNNMDIENAGVLFGKIQQIVGMCPDRLSVTSRLAQRWLYVVVWARYREEIEELGRRIPNAMTWYGGTSDEQKDRIYRTLKDDSTMPMPMVLVAQPQSCGQGMDFSRAEAMIFHSHYPSVRLHDQALSRVLAIGAGTTPVYYVCNSGIDAHIVQRLRLKTRFARITMEDIEELREYTFVSSDSRLRLLWKKLKGVDLRTL